MKKILVLGEGYLGSTFKQRGFTVLDKNAFSVQRWTDVQSCLDPIVSEYDVIINCVAKSNTRYCETNFTEAVLSNAVLPGILSDYCRSNDKRFVHISTGCLYDRNDIPQKETDFLAAHCKYTLSKWLGENSINEETDLIIRPRLLFDGSSRPNNLLNKLKGFSHLCNELESVSSTDVVVDATLELINNNCTGPFNVACDGFMTMQDIGKLLGLQKPVVSIEEVRQQQNIYLVNNTMDLTKLKKYYQPPTLESEVLRCSKTI